MAIDRKKQDLKFLYNASPTIVERVEVPPLSILSIEGHGLPGSESHIGSTGAIFSMAYTIKFALKKQDASLDHVVMPLEGLWWTDDNSNWHTADASIRHWKLLLVQPTAVTADLVEATREVVQKKKPSPYLSQIRFELFEEGPSAQILHVGPFATEDKAGAKIFSWIEENGFSIGGLHHEIYLSDYNRTAPEKLRTILRYPIK